MTLSNREIKLLDYLRQCCIDNAPTPPARDMGRMFKCSEMYINDMIARLSGDHIEVHRFKNTRKRFYGWQGKFTQMPDTGEHSALKFARTSKLTDEEATRALGIAIAEYHERRKAA